MTIEFFESLWIALAKADEEQATQQARMEADQLKD